MHGLTNVQLADPALLSCHPTDSMPLGLLRNPERYDLYVIDIGRESLLDAHAPHPSTG